MSRACSKGGATGETQFVQPEVSRGHCTDLSQASENGKDRTSQDKERTTDDLKSIEQPAPTTLFLREELSSESPNIQRDASTLAAIEKSALSDDANVLMEAIADELNMEIAWERIKANRGAPGPDGVTVKDFPSGSARNGNQFAANYLMGLTARLRSGVRPLINPMAAHASLAFQTCSTV